MCLVSFVFRVVYILDQCREGGQQGENALANQAALDGSIIQRGCVWSPDWLVWVRSVFCLVMAVLDGSIIQRGRVRSVA